MNDGRPPAGWYPDPVGATGRRYWDGSSWTAATAADAADQTGGVTPSGTIAPPAADRAPTVPSVPALAGPASGGPHAPPAGPSAAPPAESPPWAGSFPSGGSWSAAAVTAPRPAAVAVAGASPTTGRPSPRVWAGIVAVLLVMVFVLVRGGQSHEVTGTFEVFDSRYAYVADGASCSGVGGYDDIRAGTPVSVRDGAGGILAAGTLRSGYVEGLRCVFTFELIGVDRSDVYTFEVGRRGELTYSHAELAADGWHVDLYLGDG
jgi:hypothetical protein